MKFSKNDSFTFKDFYRKVPIYLSDIADFECMTEIPFNKICGTALSNIHEKCAVSLCLTLVLSYKIF